MKTKILVTGANGQLALTIKSLTINDNDLNFIFVPKNTLDITKTEKLSSFFEKNKFNYCINCAAFTNVEEAEHNPEIAKEVNAEAVNNLAAICNETNTVLIHISTDYVFDGKKNTPYKTDDETNPINEYGKSKLLGEQHIIQNLKEHFIIRTSWLYSKDYGRNFYQTIVNKAKQNLEIRVVNNQTSCPTSCEELTLFIINLIKSQTNNFGIYHFSGSKQMTWFEFAKHILIENNLLESTNIVVDNNYVTFAKRPKYSVLQNTI